MDTQNHDASSTGPAGTGTPRTKQLSLRKESLRILSGSELSNVHGGTSGTMTFELCQVLTERGPEIFETAQQLAKFNQKYADDHRGNGQVAPTGGTNYGRRGA
jgi:hypothetical protein